MKPGGPAFQSSDWHCGTAQEYQASGSGRIVLGTDGDKRGASTVKTARFGLLRWGSGLAPTAGHDPFSAQAAFSCSLAFRSQNSG
jgi:hypothetical protein